MITRQILVARPLLLMVAGGQQEQTQMIGHIVRRGTVRMLLVTIPAILCACAEPVRRDAPDGLIFAGDAGVPPLGDAGAVQTPPTSFSELCQQDARLWCQGHLNCCKDPAQRYASVGECEKAERDSCEVYFGNPVFGGCVPFDPLAAQAYLTEMAALVPTCGAKPLWYSRVFKGMVPAGGSCSYVTDDSYPRVYCCQPGTGCEVSSVNGDNVIASCGGLRQLGEDCGGVGCADGLFCGYSAATTNWTCMERKPAGGSCAHETECATEFCDNGTCKPLDVNGMYCGKSSQCLQMGWSISADYADCVTSYSCVESQRLTARCKKVGDSYSCTCEHNAVQEKTFISSTICTLDVNGLRSAVRTGCGWDQL